MSLVFILIKAERKIRPTYLTKKNEKIDESGLFPTRFLLFGRKSRPRALLLHHQASQKERLEQLIQQQNNKKQKR